jgi:hypothetical protein
LAIARFGADIVSCPVGVGVAPVPLSPVPHPANAISAQLIVTTAVSARRFITTAPHLRITPKEGRTTRNSSVPLRFVK